MKPKQTKREIKARLIAMQAQLRSSQYVAYKELEHIKDNRFLGSAVVISITGLDGKQIVVPFSCTDGLENETVKLLQQQIKKSIALSEIMRPKELTP